MRCRLAATAVAAATLVLLPIAGGAALSEELKAQSLIEAVTVFPQGAEVTRITRLSVPAGDHVVLLADLPSHAVGSSIRVEGKATGRLEIGSVDSRRMFVPRADQERIAAERKRLEDEIEKRRDERTGLLGIIQGAEAQRTLLQNMAALPTRPAGPQNAGGGENWDAVFATIGTRMADVQRVLLDTQIKVREVDRRIADLEKQLAGLAPRQDERTEVKVNVAAAASLDATLTIRYQVGGAGWTPHYDARLATGARNTAPKLALVRRASIQQRTGEDWSDVALTLSTTRPGGGTAAPELFPVTIDFEPDMPPPPPRPLAAPAPGAGGGVATRKMTERAAPESDTAQVAVAPPLQDAVARGAAVQQAPFQAAFAVPGKQTVKANGEVKRVQIDGSEIEPALVVRTVPKLDTTAYLYAKLKLPAGISMLPGQVALFRDGTFVGNGRVPLLSGGEEHELGFGADDTVRVKYAKIEEKRGERGLISSSKTDERNFKISVRNLHERPMPVMVFDQLPVSNNQEIKVDLVGSSKPTRQDVDDRRGVAVWELQVAPQEEKEVLFGYRITWPAAKRIQYGG